MPRDNRSPATHALGGQPIDQEALAEYKKQHQADEQRRPDGVGAIQIESCRLPAWNPEIDGAADTGEWSPEGGLVMESDRRALVDQAIARRRAQQGNAKAWLPGQQEGV